MYRKHEILYSELEKLPDCKVIVEIGASPFPVTDELYEGYGMSTIKLAQWAQRINAEFHSCDIDPDHILNASEILANAGLPAMFYVDDGETFLKKWSATTKIDFLYLDNASDPKLTLEQFKLAEPLMSDNSIIMLDDCHSDEWGFYSKGTTCIPYAIEKGYKVALTAAFNNSIMAIIKKEWDPILDKRYAPCH